MDWQERRGPRRAIAVDDVLQRIFDRFNVIVKQIRQRHDERPTLDVRHQYDIQNPLHALLRMYWDDMRPEEWTPS